MPSTGLFSLFKKIMLIPRQDAEFLFYSTAGEEEQGEILGYLESSPVRQALREDTFKL